MIYIAANDNRENQPSGDLSIPVCRSYWCHSEWVECEFAGLCPHTAEEDSAFSWRCYSAYKGIIDGKYKTVTEAAKDNGVSVRDFCKYRRAKGLKV